VRDDSGAYEGWAVPRFYDTLVAKLIVWGADRAAAISRMARALAEYRVAGIRTTIPLLRRLVAHEDFRAGRLSTALLERIMPALIEPGTSAERLAIVAAVLAEVERGVDVVPAPSTSSWRLASGQPWRSR
jgi:acetyl/propionyl-CoA carboxylase alpha subunit